MSNMGLEIALRQSGIEMLRAPVGDKYVLEEMQKTGAVLGGEQSGHIILRAKPPPATACSPRSACLRLCSAASGNSLAELVADLKVLPQTIKNVRVREKRPLEQIPEVMAAIQQGRERVERQRPHERSLFRHGIPGTRDGGSRNRRDGAQACRRHCGSNGRLRLGPGVAH